MLYLFDLDGTLIEGSLDLVGGKLTSVHPYERVEPLPRRREKLDELRAEGHSVAVVTNQGGAAFGHQTEAEINDKLHQALTLLGWKEPSAYVCMAHPQATIRKYREGHKRRKPSPSMLNEAMNEWGYAPHETVFVGDLPTDQQAAEAANVKYIDAEVFFAPNGEVDTQ